MIIDPLIDWLIRLSVDWLIDPLFDWLIRWLIDWLIDWFVCRLIDWMNDRMIFRMVDWLIDWLWYYLRAAKRKVFFWPRHWVPLIKGVTQLCRIESVQNIISLCFDTSGNSKKKSDVFSWPGYLPKNAPGHGEQRNLSPEIHGALSEIIDWLRYLSEFTPNASVHIFLVS